MFETDSSSYRLMSDDYLNNFYEQIRERNKRAWGDRRFEVAEWVQAQYPGTQHFIAELVQNADDVGANEIGFKIIEDGLLIYNNGRVFNEQDVWAISGLWDSLKKLNDSGYFGIGFKSVLSITNTPYIFSDKYAFFLEYGIDPYGLKNFDKLPIDLQPILSEKLGKTYFWLPFKPGLNSSQLREEIIKHLEESCALSLIFCKNLKKIRFEDEIEYCAEIEKKIT